jgi:hypothetical protein
MSTPEREPPDLTSGGRKPWDRQPNESDTAYYCFTVYRDDGALNRSGSRVVSECGRPLSLVQRWRSRWWWVERARAWDAYQDDLRRREVIAESIAMGQRQATEARAIQQAMMVPVRELLRRMTDILEVDAVRRMSLADLMVLSVQTSRLWPAAAHAERVARGAPTPDYGAYDVETEGEVVAPAAFDVEPHLAEVWLAMEEAGLRPRLAPPLELPPGETNGHVENGHENGVAE